MSILEHSPKISKGIRLIDKSSTGRIRPWKTHKKKSTLLGASYIRLGKEKKGQRVSDCAGYQLHNTCPNGHERFLKRANFCGVRLCPMCGWRRSLKAGYQVKRIAHVASQSMKLRWVFLTLTCRNIEGDELPNQLDLLTKSWKRLTETKAFKKNVLGFFRATEVTRDADRFITEERYKKGKKHYDSNGIKIGDINTNFNTYHPHFHVILAVPPSYFSHGYIKTAEWVQMWRKAMRADYDPVVHIETVKPKRNIEAEKKLLEAKGIIVDEIADEIEQLPNEAVAELAKYATKADDFLIEDDNDQTDEAVNILDKSLRGRKLFAYGGVLKDVYDYLRKNGEVEDVESDNADLVHTDEKDKNNCKCSVCDSTFLEEVYTWLPDRKDYFLSFREDYFN